MIKKLYLGIKSVLLFVFFKLRYGRRISMRLINSIKGNINIDLDSDGKITIRAMIM